MQGEDVSFLVIAMPSGDISEGQSIRFHYRTSLSSSTEFKDLLKHHEPPRESHQDSAVVMFPCVGRGKSFYGLPNHESTIVEETLGKVSASLRTLSSSDSCRSWLTDF